MKRPSLTTTRKAVRWNRKVLIPTQVDRERSNSVDPIVSGVGYLVIRGEWEREWEGVEPSSNTALRGTR